SESVSRWSVSTNQAVGAVAVTRIRTTTYSPAAVALAVVPVSSVSPVVIPRTSTRTGPLSTVTPTATSPPGGTTAVGEGSGVGAGSGEKLGPGEAGVGEVVGSGSASRSSAAPTTA